MHLILIDNYTGYIFADTRDLPGWRGSAYENESAAMIAAAALADAALGNHGRIYKVESRPSFSNETGYHVHRVDVEGPTTVVVVRDGQNEKMIQAVETFCPKIGFVRCLERND